MERPDAGGDPVTVLTVRDPGVLAVAQSLLDGADIPYFTKGESVQNLMPFLTWVEVQVGADDADEARALLADLAS